MKAEGQVRPLWNQFLMLTSKVTAHFPVCMVIIHVPYTETAPLGIFLFSAITD
jgi:hypothetical protein